MSVNPIFVYQSKVSDLAKEYVDRVLSNGWIGLGKETELFECEFAKYIGAKYAIAFNSATAALHVALRCADVSVGSSVLTTSMTFVSTNAAIVYCGAFPIFLDINKRTLYNDLSTIKAVSQKMNKRFSAVMLVHYGGNPIPKEGIMQLKKCLPEGVAIINDLSHCAGAIYEDGTKAGSFGAYNVFSFHAVKNLATPDGGMLTTDSDIVANRAKKLRWMGIDKDTITRTKTGSEDSAYTWKYDVTDIGYKYHLNDVSAAIGRAHLKSLDVDNDRRRAIQEYYEVTIKSPFVTRCSSVIQSGHMAVVRIKGGKRDSVIRKLKDEYNIHPGVHYTPNHLFEPFKKYLIDEHSLKETMAAYDEIITLPCHLLMSDFDVDRVVSAVNKIIES